MEDVADPRQCVVNADCGSLAHAESICDHAGYCHPACEDYWGDCNQDYRDGCEAQIKNRIYCEGDPRINQYFPPHIFVISQNKISGSGHFDADTFDRGLECYRAPLEQCYERLLEKAPTVEGTLCYQLTLGEAGRITRSKLVRSEITANETTGKAVEACVSSYLAEVTYDDRPAGGPIEFEYCFYFAPGHFNTDDQPQR